MKTDFLANNINNTTRGDLSDERIARFSLKVLISAASMIVAAISFAGCADGYYAAGYGPAYYAPDYGPYYAEYVYDGSPYWGPGAYYDTDIVIGGVHHHRYYGGHHFAHEWSGAHARAAGVPHAAAPGGVHAPPAGGGGGRRP